MAEVGDIGVEKEKGGENVEKPVWYTEFVWKPTDEATKVLAANNIQVDEKVLFDKIPFASEHITAVKDTIKLKGDKVSIKGHVITTVYVKICYDREYNEVPKDSPDKYSCEEFYDPSDYVISQYGYDTENLINDEINKFVIEKQRLPNKEEVRDIILSVLKKIQNELDAEEERKQALMQKARQWLEKKRREHEEWLKKKKAEEEEKKKREEEIKQRLLSKPWVKAIVEQNTIENERKKEIERFKKKFNLVDDEMDSWEVSAKPFVHIEASVDLRPVGIKRTIIIRNFAPDDYHMPADYYKDSFSDLSLIIAKFLKKYFNGKIEIYTDASEEYAYLVVVSDNDYLEVASNEIADY